MYSLFWHQTRTLNEEACINRRLKFLTTVLKYASKIAAQRGHRAVPVFIFLTTRHSVLLRTTTKIKCSFTLHKDCIKHLWHGMQYSSTDGTTSHYFHHFLREATAFYLQHSKMLSGTQHVFQSCNRSSLKCMMLWGEGCSTSTKFTLYSSDEYHSHSLIRHPFIWP